MKNIIYAIIVSALMLQSCSHTIIYKEAEYKAPDSQYPVQALEFAYLPNNITMPSSLTNIGNRVFQQAKADNNYKTALSSAVDYEKDMNSSFKENGQLESKIADGKQVLQSTKSSNDHKSVANRLSNSYDALSKFSPNNSKDSWKRVYQLSHRGIIQHYMNLDADYRRLNGKDKALVYGYILNKDVEECNSLAEAKVREDENERSSVMSSLRREISSRESILAKIEQQKKAEEEKLRKQREAEEREKQAKIQREQAQRRWNDDSWMDGKWNLRTPYGISTIYIDTASQRIKHYMKLYSDNPLRPADCIYNGRYIINTGTADGKNCRVLDFGDTMIIAYPDNGKLRDLDGGYFIR